MKSISDKARSIFSGLAVKSRTLWSSLPASKINIFSVIKPSGKKLPVQAIKEHPQNYSARKTGNQRTYTWLSFNEKWKKVAIGLTAGLCLLAIISAGIANSSEKAFAVTIDGQQIAYTKDKAAARKVLEELKQQKAKQWKQKLMVKEKVAYKATEAKRYQILDSDELKEVFNEELTFTGVATGIKVNGKLVAVVKDNAAANQVLEDLKKRFTENLTDYKTEKVAFAEKIEIVETPADLNEVREADEVVEKLLNGKEKAKVHIVKEGDSLWTIARKYDTHVVDLKVANPGLKGENPKLDIGQEVKLVKMEPLVTVLVTAEATRTETIPYKVRVETDKSMWKGKQKVTQQGENGSREVTYQLVFANGAETERKVLNDKVLKPAKDRVVVRGAKLVVASRSGSGRLAWPTSGKITSPFGRRWGSRHTGLDIDGYTGQPVGAADDGTVVSAGWDGAYGKQVTISHGNGMKTKYAHLSSIDVSVGDKVSKGELIGKVGSTGRSTGSHLHFEVMVGGSFRNPMSYLK